MTGTNGGRITVVIHHSGRRVVEEVEAVFGDLLIEWVALAPGSPSVDRSASEILRVGDRLVVVSRPQDLGPFRDLVVG